MFTLYLHSTYSYKKNRIMSLYYQLKLNNSLSMLNRAFFILFFRENCFYIARFPFICENRSPPKMIYRTKTIKTYFLLFDYTFIISIGFTSGSWWMMRVLSFVSSSLEIYETYETLKSSFSSSSSSWFTRISSWLLILLIITGSDLSLPSKWYVFVFEKGLTA
jgi:hypothetical protein